MQDVETPEKELLTRPKAAVILLLSLVLTHVQRALGHRTPFKPGSFY